MPHDCRDVDLLFGEVGIDDMHHIVWHIIVVHGWERDYV